MTLKRKHAPSKCLAMTRLNVPVLCVVFFFVLQSVHVFLVQDCYTLFFAMYIVFFCFIFFKSRIIFKFILYFTLFLASSQMPRLTDRRSVPGGRAPPGGVGRLGGRPLQASLPVFTGPCL